MFTPQVNLFADVRSTVGVLAALRLPAPKVSGVEFVDGFALGDRQIEESSRQFEHAVDQGLIYPVLFQNKEAGVVAHRAKFHSPAAVVLRESLRARLAG